jgi:nucleotide-binding universal stress UspA family protein
VLPVSRDRLEQELLSWAERNVEEAARQVPEHIPITKLVTRGRAAAALLREARTGCWDLVVVGKSHGRRRLLGSVGVRLNRRAGVPVLVVHEDPSDVRPDRPAAGVARRPAGAGARSRGLRSYRASAASAT